MVVRIASEAPGLLDLELCLSPVGEKALEDRKIFLWAEDLHLLLASMLLLVEPLELLDSLDGEILLFDQILVEREEIFSFPAVDLEVGWPEAVSFLCHSSLLVMDTPVRFELTCPEFASQALAIRVTV